MYLNPDVSYIPPEYNLNSDTTEFYQNRIKQEADNCGKNIKI